MRTHLNYVCHRSSYTCLRKFLLAGVCNSLTSSRFSAGFRIIIRHDALFESSFQISFSIMCTLLCKAAIFFSISFRSFKSWKLCCTYRLFGALASTSSAICRILRNFVSKSAATMQKALSRKFWAIHVTDSAIRFLLDSPNLLIGIAMSTEQRVERG